VNVTKNYKRVPGFEVKSFVNDFEESVILAEDKDAFDFRTYAKGARS